MGTEFLVSAEGYRISHGSWESGQWRPTACPDPSDSPQLSEPRPSLGWTEGAVVVANSPTLVAGGDSKALRRYFGGSVARIQDSDILGAVNRYGLPFGGAYSWRSVGDDCPVNSLGEIRHQVHLYQRTSWLVSSLMRGEGALLRRLEQRGDRTYLPLLPRFRAPAVTIGRALVHPDPGAVSKGVAVPGVTEDDLWGYVVDIINSQLPLFSASPRLEFRASSTGPRRAHFVESPPSWLEALWLDLARTITEASPLRCSCGDRIWARSTAKTSCQRCTQRRYDQRRAVNG